MVDNDILGATQYLMPDSSKERVFDGNLNGVTWYDENNNAIDDINAHLKEKAEKNFRESLKKYMPIGSVVKFPNRIGMYMIIGYKYKVDDRVFDYFAVKYPQGFSMESFIRNANNAVFFFNHDEIKEVHHVGMSNDYQRAYKEKLLEADAEGITDEKIFFEIL